jgi:hypothetical protein
MELWRDVPEYEGFYQVSDDGRVRRLWQVIPSAFVAGVRKHRNYLKPGMNNQGRLQVTLSKNAESRRFLVHRLVLLAFAGPCPDGFEGRHKVKNYSDNRIGNLFWSPCDARSDSVGRSIGHSTLTEQDVRDIRTSSESERAMAKQYGVSHVAIHNIRTRKTWKHV